MKKLGRSRLGLVAWALAAITRAGLGAVPLSQPATAPSAPTATAPAKKVTVDDILATRKPAAFDFDNAKITDIAGYIAKSYDVQIQINPDYSFSDLLTMKNAGGLSAREAINILNSLLLAQGYSLVESVRNSPAGPYVVLTVVPMRADAGKPVPVFRGNDPATIPEDAALRTQVLNLHAVDPENARAMIIAVVGKQAEITLNASTRTLVITDTGAHVHTAAALLQTLEKQTVDNK